jgi:hypothetical protein
MTKSWDHGHVSWPLSKIILIDANSNSIERWWWWWRRWR